MIGQIALGVVGKADRGTIGPLHLDGSSAAVARDMRLAAERVDLPNGQAALVQLEPRRMPLPVDDLGQLAGLGIAQRELAPLGILHAHEVPAPVVPEAGHLAERVDGAHELAAAVVLALPHAARGVDALDRHVQLVVSPASLLPERVAFEDPVATIVEGPLGAVAEPVDLRRLPVLLGVPLVLRLDARRIDLAIDQARGVTPVVRPAAARVVHDGDVLDLVVGDSPVEDPAVAPGADAPAVGVVPLVLEVEREAVPVGLLDHHASLVGVPTRVARRIVRGSEPAFRVIGVTDELDGVAILLEQADGVQPPAPGLEGETAADAVDDLRESAVLVAELDGVLAAVGDPDERVGDVRALDGLEVVREPVPEGESVALLRTQQRVAVDRIPGRLADTERVVGALAPVGEAHLDADGAALLLFVDRDVEGVMPRRPERAFVAVAAVVLALEDDGDSGLADRSRRRSSRSRPVITSTGWPVSVQMSQLKNLPGLSRLNSLSENHLVRMPWVTAAIQSIASGPPTTTGAPRGTAMSVDVGRLSGKLHVVTIEPRRAAEDPAKLTVLLPVTMLPSLPGMSLGAKETPGGVGMCLATALTAVPVPAARMPLTKTAPPRREPIAAPTGSQT